MSDFIELHVYFFDASPDEDTVFVVNKDYIGMAERLYACNRTIVTLKNGERIEVTESYNYIKNKLIECGALEDDLK